MTWSVCQKESTIATKNVHRHFRLHLALFQVCWYLLSSLSAHTHTLMAVVAMQVANILTWSNVGFGILLKDTSCNQGVRGMNQQLSDYWTARSRLLSDSHHTIYLKETLHVTSFSDSYNFNFPYPKHSHQTLYFRVSMSRLRCNRILYISNVGALAASVCGLGWIILLQRCLSVEALLATAAAAAASLMPKIKQTLRMSHGSAYAALSY